MSIPFKNSNTILRTIIKLPSSFSGITFAYFNYFLPVSWILFSGRYLCNGGASSEKSERSAGWGF